MWKNWHAKYYTAVFFKCLKLKKIISYLLLLKILVSLSTTFFLGNSLIRDDYLVSGSDLPEKFFCARLIKHLLKIMLFAKKNY